jgi:hypothetical protein
MNMPTLESLQSQIDELKKQNEQILRSLAVLTETSNKESLEEAVKASVKEEPVIMETEPITADETAVKPVLAEKRPSLNIALVMILVFGVFVSFALNSVWLGVILIAVIMAMIVKSNMSGVSENTKMIASPGQPETEERAVTDSGADKADSDNALEERIGIKWFLAIGILALVIGAGFFIKYAIDNGYIGYLGRIILGVLAGGATIVLGQWAAKKPIYHQWGKTLAGGGLAIIYFSVYAAYHLPAYRYAIGISQGLDIFLLALVGLFATFISIKNDSQIIAGESFFLGFVTAIIGQNFSATTLFYNLILALVLLVVAVYKKWPNISLLGIVGSYLTYGIWYAYHPHNFGLGLAFLSVYYLVYLAAGFLIKAQDQDQRVAEQYRIGLTLLNTILYFILGMVLIKENYPAYDALFTFVMALVSGAAYYAALIRKSGQLEFVHFYLALFFLTIAIPMQFNHDAINIIWSLELLLLTALWSKTDYKGLKNAAHAVWAFVILKVIFFDISLGAFRAYDLAASSRFISFSFAIICIYWSYALLAKKQDLLERDGEPWLFFYSLSATLLLPLMLFLEWPHEIAMVTYVLSFALLALVLIPARWRHLDDLRSSFAALSLILLIKILAVDLWRLRAFSPEDIFLSARLWVFLAVSLGFYLCALVIKKYWPEEQRPLSSVYAWLGTFLLALIAGVESSGPTFWMTFWWSFLSIILLLAGIAGKHLSLKRQATALAVVIAFKLLLFDWSLPPFNWLDLGDSQRFIDFIIAISLFYLSAAVISGLKDKTGEDRSLLNFYTWAGSLAGGLIILLEIRDYWITVCWAVFGASLLLIGFWRQGRQLRYQGLALIMLTIIKVFFYDTRELSTIYRTISFMVLGVILLALSFLYNKYKDKIRKIL